MGTPEFALPSLEVMAKRHHVVDVVTQPDRPAGRGRSLRPPPIKAKAEQLGLRVCQPARVGDAAMRSRLAEDAPDVIVVVGFGQMIPKSIRNMSEHGCINVHSSLLPKYRGAAPVHWAIANGETQTGVSTMRIVRQLDAGDVLLSQSTEIGPDESATDLNARLAPVGAELLLETLDGLADGTVTPSPQDHSAATQAPRLRREDGLVEWTTSAQSIYNRMRGFTPWPGIYSFFRGKRLRILAARPEQDAELEPGTVRMERHALSVGCGSGRLVLEEVQVEGRKRMSAHDFARGSRIGSGERFVNA